METAFLNASPVQDSMISPTAYIVGASDLHPVNSFNVLVKYADDTYLPVSSYHLNTALEEFVHITNRAKNNNLRLNASKRGI